MICSNRLLLKEQWICCCILACPHKVCFEIVQITCIIRSENNSTTQITSHQFIFTVLVWIASKQHLFCRCQAFFPFYSPLRTVCDVVKMCLVVLLNNHYLVKSLFYLDVCLPSWIKVNQQRTEQIWPFLMILFSYIACIQSAANAKELLMRFLAELCFKYIFIILVLI